MNTIELHKLLDEIFEQESLKINRIKKLRQCTTLGLREAKEMVDNHTYGVSRSSDRIREVSFPDNEKIRYMTQSAFVEFVSSYLGDFTVKTLKVEQ